MTVSERRTDMGVEELLRWAAEHGAQLTLQKAKDRYPPAKFWGPDVIEIQADVKVEGGHGSMCRAVGMLDKKSMESSNAMTMMVMEVLDSVKRQVDQQEEKGEETRQQGEGETKV